ncbi:MAG TPA: hypothetical protein VGB95_04700, partial [Chitinophagales bacterium]
MKHFLGITLTFFITQIFAQDIVTGAERTTDYLPILYGKKVALVVNQTSVIGETHLLDSLETMTDSGVVYPDADIVIIDYMQQRTEGRELERYEKSGSRRVFGAAMRVMR